jgi:hypothetical protein
MKIYKLLLFYFFIVGISHGQKTFHLETGIKAGTAIIYNSSITHVGYVHDYRLGGAYAANVLLRKNWKKNVLSLGAQLQFTKIRYQNYSIPSYLDTNAVSMDYVHYENRMIQIQLLMGFHRKLPLGFEIGMYLTPTYIYASHEYFNSHIYANIDYEYEYYRTTKNNPAYNRFVLLGSIELAKVQTLKSGKSVRYTLSPTISLSNPGGVNSYGVAMSPKGNFSSFYVNAQAGIAYQFR